jgi:hypothetical protein
VPLPGKGEVLVLALLETYVRFALCFLWLGFGMLRLIADWDGFEDETGLASFGGRPLHDFLRGLPVDFDLLFAKFYDFFLFISQQFLEFFPLAF